MRHHRWQQLLTLRQALAAPVEQAALPGRPVAPEVPVHLPVGAALPEALAALPRPVGVVDAAAVVETVVTKGPYSFR